MASHAETSHSIAERGQMAIAEQSATFKSVMGMFKWGSLWTAATLVLLTMSSAPRRGSFRRRWWR